MFAHAVDFLAFAEENGNLLLECVGLGAEVPTNSTFSQ